MIYINIQKYYTKKQLKQIFNYLNSQSLVNNDFFQYINPQIKNYKNINDKFNIFYNSWINFQKKKRIIENYLKKNKINYPTIFNKKERIIIDTFQIDYSNILQNINGYRILNKRIPYSYQILVKKLIKNILLNQIYKQQKIIYNINLIENKINISLYINQNKIKNISYKIDKLLLKYQKKYPLKYKKCKAYLVISSNWKDLLLQSTFKQWTSCLNLFFNSPNKIINYSLINGIKAGNLVAYCIFDLNDNKSIDQIMNDNNYNGLMYQRCFWRCSIKRYINTKNYNNYLFCAQHTSYGTIIQNYITYKYQLFTKINQWLLKLNKKICKINQIIQIFKFPYNIYSDLHSFNQEVQKKNIYLFNINFKKLNNLSTYKINKIKQYINYNKKLFTNDLLALLSVFHYFQQNNIKNINTNQDKYNFILYKYILNKHYVLNNSIKTEKILKNNK